MFATQIMLPRYLIVTMTTVIKPEHVLQEKIQRKRISANVLSLTWVTTVRIVLHIADIKIGVLMVLVWTIIVTLNAAVILPEADFAVRLELKLRMVRIKLKNYS